MSYTLRWTPESMRTFNQNLRYLEEEWGSQVINSFLNRVEGVLEKVRVNPELYSVYRSQDRIYKCVVHKRIVLYYRIINDRYVDLLTFWNTYQNPDKLKV